MSYRSALRNYVLSKPEDLGSDILLSESERCITIFDKFPKAMFHFLILPKLDKTVTAGVTTNLSTDAEAAKLMIEDEMTKQHGFQWDVFIGFHAVPSMDHVHLHVISSDLCSPGLKKKQHYNSFRPDIGFFLHLDDVLKWFDYPSATPFSKGPTFESNAIISAPKYEPLLKRGLECFKCQGLFKTIPQLKAHLKEEWNSQKIEHQKKNKRPRIGSPVESVS
ncbi:scavenger mRNA-decapping enzyme DcpS [Rhizoctonia solani]|uniref:Scavenger mRNA-decapping enzyme DcpS n=1 Tax=Rhizoctonia solani TaxID=456999 RepID=A0A8H8T1Y2_9AGAM|nr:scavenger mRNA-decapping enzyme DcpS [Rhizoctonia solani]QRW26936.1 scavenger mRNA-decapping enzyme DcpS [Rhizoctonia solani]